MKETIIYFSLFAALLLGFCFVPRQKKTKIVCVSLLLIAMLFELGVANFHSFHLSSGRYTQQKIDLDSATVLIEGTEADRRTSNDRGEEVIIRLTSLDTKVGTLEIVCDMPDVTHEGQGTPFVDVAIDAMDESHAASYRTDVADAQIVRGDDRSSIIVLDLTGKVSELRIRMHVAEGETFAIQSMSLNRPLPFRFSILRSAILLLVPLAIYALATFPSMRAPYERGKKRFLGISFSMTAVFMLAAIALTFMYQYDTSRGVLSNFLSTSGNQITQELVDAFRAGQVSLLDRPSEDLMALNNPYDWSERIAANVNYKWDHLLFDGKYYSYYGIAPVILLFLPYNLLTGAYFPTAEAVLLFGGLGILFLSLLYMEFVDRFCRGLPLNMLIAGLIILQLSSGVWYNFCSPLFYEIAQTAGFLFTCAGFFFLLRSRVIGGEGKIRFGSLLLAVFCLATAVLCRPTLAVYCVAALPFLVFGFFKLKNHLHLATSKTKRERMWTYVGYISASLSFFVVFGVAQMVYNYVRFGSPFDFGIQYSLTINDFTRSQYHTDFVAVGLYNFLLAFPQIHPNFPYVFSNLSTLSVNGYYFIATTSAVGLLWRALPTFGYLGIGSAWKSLQKRERWQAVLLWLPVCVIAPLVILFSIWESGYAVRYCTDFAWQLVLGGMSIFFLLYAYRAQPQTKTIVERFFLIAALLAVVVNGALIYGFMSRDGYMQSVFLSFERLFDFWK